MGGILALGQGFPDNLAIVGECSRFFACTEAFDDGGTGDEFLKSCECTRLISYQVQFFINAYPRVLDI